MSLGEHAFLHQSQTFFLNHYALPLFLLKFGH
jgi:hypothetical protein